jgi:hypothetical protein
MPQTRQTWQRNRTRAKLCGISVPVPNFSSREWLRGRAAARAEIEAQVGSNQNQTETVSFV